MDHHQKSTTSYGHEAQLYKYIKQDLFKERKKNIELQRQLELAQRKGLLTKEEVKKPDINEKYKQLKKDFRELLDAFNRSEKLRREQKEIIHGLKKELTEVRRQRCDDVPTKDLNEPKAKRSARLSGSNAQEPKSQQSKVKRKRSKSKQHSAVQQVSHAR